MSRGDRLAAERRKKEKCKRIIKESWYQSPNMPSLSKNEKFIGKMAAAPHPCSGMCCGNPRRHYKGKGKLTMQELKVLRDMKEAASE